VDTTGRNAESGLNPIYFDCTFLCGGQYNVQRTVLKITGMATRPGADIRRSGALTLYPGVKSDNPDLPNPPIQHIRRINFITDEKLTNGVEVDKAVPLLGPGGDKITTPLRWDKN